MHRRPALFQGHFWPWPDCVGNTWKQNLSQETELTKCHVAFIITQDYVLPLVRNSSNEFIMFKSTCQNHHCQFFFKEKKLQKHVVLRFFFRKRGTFLIKTCYCGWLGLQRVELQMCFRLTRETFGAQSLIFFSDLGLRVDQTAVFQMKGNSSLNALFPAIQAHCNQMFLTLTKTQESECTFIKIKATGDSVCGLRIKFCIFSEFFL